jgi:heme-degrading monooxygenase HmoA
LRLLGKETLMRRRIVLFGIAAVLALAVSLRAESPSDDARADAQTAQPNASASPDTRGNTKRMIARIWHGRTLTAKADDYEKYLQASGVKKILATDGNHGIEVLRRTDALRTDFIVISYWESIEAIKRFAGADFRKAVILPRDGEYLIEVEPEVVHYEVVRAAGR